MPSLNGEGTNKSLYTGYPFALSVMGKQYNKSRALADDKAFFS